MTTQWGPENPFWDAFETEPTGRRANYFGRLAGQPRQSPNQRRFFEQQFEDIQDRYLGALGRMVQGGQSPTLALSDYLDDYFSPQGGESERDYGVSRARGDDNAFAPATRWNVSGGPIF